MIGWVIEKIFNAAYAYWKRTPIDEIKEKAENGDAEAQYYLALAYYKGEQVNKNYSEALKWMRRAAEEENYTEAQFLLARMYFEGIGTPKYIPEAERWYIKAAEQGHLEAQRVLASTTVTV